MGGEAGIRKHYVRKTPISIKTKKELGNSGGMCNCCHLRYSGLNMKGSFKVFLHMCKFILSVVFLYFLLHTH